MAQEVESRSTTVAGLPPVTFTWTIKNFTKLDRRAIYSDIFVVGGYKWRILVHPKGNKLRYLSMYLDAADSYTLPFGWSRKAEFSLTVVNQINGNDSIKRETGQQFGRKVKDWGFTSFIPLQNLLDPKRGYLVNDTVVLQARVSSCDPKKEMDVDKIPLIPALGTQSVGHTGSIQSSSSLQVISKNLLAELSNMNRTQTCSSSSEISHSSQHPNPSPESLKQQREALLNYFTLSLEAAEQANAFNDMEKIALALVQHSDNSLERTILKDLVSRLATFKKIIPSTKSIVQNAQAKRSSLSEKSTNLRARLDQGQEQLSSLDAKLSKLSEEEVELAVEIQKLTTQKQELLVQKNIMALELEKINQQVSKDLEEWKNLGKETEQSENNWFQAREKLAQANLSWELFKQSLQQSEELSAVPSPNPSSSSSLPPSCRPRSSRPPLRRHYSRRPLLSNRSILPPKVD